MFQKKCKLNKTESCVYLETRLANIVLALFIPIELRHFKEKGPGCFFSINSNHLQ